MMLHRHFEADREKKAVEHENGKKEFKSDIFPAEEPVKKRGRKTND